MANPYFRIIDPSASGKSVKLCVFHHAGGSSGAYYKWKKALPESWGLILCELPGRGARYKEPLVEDFAQLILELTTAFEESVMGPVVLAGHSMGALLAYELYRHLKLERAKNVQGILLSSFLPPTQENLAAREKIAHLPEEEFLSKLKGYAELPTEVLSNLQTRKYFVSLLRADLRVLENYTNSDFSKKDVPILISGGAQDRVVEASRLEDWSKFGKVIAKPSIFEGDHFYISERFPELIALAFSIFS